ncbi:MAG: hypothetical protein GX457_12970 [Thermotogaceae bacterium]|nr:hypothetical protein [Thermotogaceae bacterium]
MEKTVEDKLKKELIGKLSPQKLKAFNSLDSQDQLFVVALAYKLGLLAKDKQ